MDASAASKRSRRHGWYRCLLQLLAAAWALWTAAAAAQTVQAAARYRVVQLSSDRYAAVALNARGQVAFTENVYGAARAKFYDGQRIVDFGTPSGASTRVAGLNNLGQVALNVDRGGTSRAMLYDGVQVRDLGTLGGRAASAAGLNDLGQVAGTSGRAAERSPAAHLFRWSPATGMVDLGVPGQRDPVVFGINGRGEIFGRATFGTAAAPQTRGFFWSAATGIVDIGVLGDFSVPGAMNDAGTIVGYAGSGPNGILAFRWTLAEGIGDMGTRPDEFTWAVHVNGAGQVVGATPFAAGQQAHPFLWTPERGLLDLGVGTAARGAGSKVNAHGMVIGYLFEDFILSHGFVWTRETGLVELGAGDDLLATWAADVNDRGEVVGAIGRRAIVWTRARGAVDLNTLARFQGPVRTLLDAATAISPRGDIVATGSGGLYLLVPETGPWRAGQR